MRRTGICLVAVLSLAPTACSGRDDSAPLVRAAGLPATTVAPAAQPPPSAVSTTVPSTPPPMPAAVPPGPARQIPAARPAPPRVAPGPARAVITPTGVVAAVLGGDAGGWRVRTPCGNVATVEGGTPLAGATVVLDPGHGGSESGARGPNGLSEGPLNLAVVGHAKAALERAGVQVVSTRTAEYEVTLATRTELATKLQPRAFVSVHHNAEPDGAWPRPGSETYYQIGSPTSKRLAGLLWEEIVRALSAYPLPWVADRDAGAKYRQGANGDYYAILRQAAGVTTSLAELAFVSNPPEADLLARPDVQKVEGEAVARAILRYLTTDEPGSGFVEPYPRPPPPPGGGGGGERCVDPRL